MENKLKYALILAIINFAIEVSAGIYTSSLALLSDAAHVLTDITALTISLIAIKIGKRATDKRRTYGYRRFEIIAAAINAILLFAVSIYIMFEAYQRFMHLPEIHSEWMLAVSIMGLIINIICARLLISGSKTSLNIKAAYVDAIADLISSVGVIIAAITIYYTGWTKIDPIIAVLIGLWILPRSWKLLAESFHILLEGTPDGIDINQLLQDLKTIPGVIDAHDLHIWAITSGLNNLTAHLVVAQHPQNNSIIKKAMKIAKAHSIEHTNFQIEIAPANAAANTIICELHANNDHLINKKNYHD
jgi:cobalt-zinc-cadmium efflux system protein